MISSSSCEKQKISRFLPRAATLLVALALWGTGATKAQAWWTYLETTGAPLATQYLGDPLTNLVNFAVNTGTSGWTVQFGMGTTTSGSGWEWANAVWYKSSGNNQYWRSVPNSLLFKATGKVYYSGLFRSGSRTEYASAGWAADRTTLSASSYFNVNALNTPSGQNAVAANHSQINLSWTRGVSGNAKNTMIVRSTSSTFTAPTQGSAYAVNASLGAGKVIYAGSGTSSSDTGLDESTTYYYAYYAENNSYYSDAVTKSAATPAAPLVAPSVQSSSIGMNNSERQDQLTPVWTAGNGARRVVIARQNAAPTGTPADGSDYTATANNNFSAAPSLGDGKVVFAGTGNSFTMTGLSPNSVYYFRVFEYNGTGASTLYLTTSASGNPASGTTLGPPTGLSATPSTVNPESRLDLNWTKHNGKNVMIVQSTSSTFTAPTQGSAYTTGATLGSGTVLYKGAATAVTVSSLTPATKYYYAFYSENNNYYSTAGVTDGTPMPTARNTGGSASPGSPAGTLYLGDTGVFTVEAQAKIGNNWSASRVLLSADSNVDANDPAGAWVGYTDQPSRSLTSARFFQTGTLYWAIQLDYGSPYNDTFWYKASSAAWAPESVDGSGSTLTITVSPLNAPTSQLATPAGANQVNLSWTRGVSGSAKNTMIVRSTSSTFTAPVQTSAYSSGDPIGNGTVIYLGGATSASDTSLSAGTTYYYAFYAENYSYYSPAATANATTPNVGPSIQAKTISAAGSERSNQLTFTWVNGNGSRRVAVASAGSAPSAAATPSDGADYSASANSNFSAAPSLADGKIVYDGTGNSFTMTGLAADTVYYLRVFEYNGTGSSTLYNTNSATDNPGSGATLGPPTALSAARNGSYPLTRVDLGWAKNAGKNVMVVQSTSSAFTAPTQGSTYSTGATLGAGTVVYKGSATSASLSGLMPGVTYYYAFYSENYSYYSPADSASVTLATPEVRNIAGGASPGSPAGTLYLGDNATFTAEATGIIEGNWSRSRVWLSADANVGVGPDLDGAWANFQNTTGRTNTSARFFQTGTLYWAMQFDYGAPYNTSFWYKASSATWTPLAQNANGSTLTISVSPLNAPTSPNATAASGTQIDLNWTKGVSGTAKSTMIVRSTSSSFTAPTQGSAYSSGASLGNGTVVYNGSATSFSDTGLSVNTTYYYAFYAENYTYYSAAANASETTLSFAGPGAPTATAATNPGWTSFTLNWSAVAGAAGYRIDVAATPDFSGDWEVQNYDVGNITSVGITNLLTGRYFYRVRAYNAAGDSPNSNVITVNLGTAQGRNKSAGATPYYTPATLYVGDTATFGVDTWGTILGNWADARAVIKKDANIGIGGLYGAFPISFDDAEYTEAVSPRFTSAGTWYWGIQMNYGSPYGTNFWMVRNSASWVDLAYKGTNSDLTVTVLPLGEPSSVSATQDGSDPQHQINLSWAQWNSKAVLVVRSTTSNFTTPTPGAAYTAGNSIGSGKVLYRGSSATSVSDTGLTPGMTYYYRFYTENWSYYSAGEDANANTTPGCSNGTAPTMMHPGNKVIYANNSAQLNFTITAADTPGCNAPTFTVSALPSGATFTPSISGNQNTGSFSWTPQLSQVGTYPIRFTATDSENLSTSLIVKVIVGIGSPQEGNTGGIPHSQYNWAVTITNIDVDLSGNASIIYRSTNGMAYDVYQSDSTFGGGMSWSRVEANRLANGSIDYSDQNYVGARRYFQVVPAGTAPTTNGIWGVIRPTIRTGWNLLSPPLATDLKFNGAFGENLALALSGAGTQNSSDQLHGTDNSGNPFVLWINSNDNNRWYEGASPATRTLNPGQGFLLYRQGGMVQLPLIGPVGNTGNNSITLKKGQWTMFGLSEGKSLVGNPLPGSLSGSPVASFQYEAADILSVLNPDGSWKNYQRFGNNVWLDLKTMQQSSSITMQPGDGFYYYRQPGSDLTIGF